MRLISQLRTISVVPKSCGAPRKSRDPQHLSRAAVWQMCVGNNRSLSICTRLPCGGKLILPTARRLSLGQSHSSGSNGVVCRHNALLCCCPKQRFCPRCCCLQLKLPVGEIAFADRSCVDKVRVRGPSLTFKCNQNSDNRRLNVRTCGQWNVAPGVGVDLGFRAGGAHCDSSPSAALPPPHNSAASITPPPHPPTQEVDHTNKAVHPRDQLPSC